MATRKKYTREFKEDAVRLVTEQGYRAAEAARNLGIDRGMLARWVKELQEDGAEAFRGNGQLNEREQELRREVVKQLAQASCQTYGSRRMAKALGLLGYRLGRYQARCLMREAGVRVCYRRRYRVTTNSDHRQALRGISLARNPTAYRAGPRRPERKHSNLAGDAGPSGCQNHFIPFVIARGYAVGPRSTREPPAHG